MKALKIKVDVEGKWKENLERARIILASKNKNQLEIAKLALEVCEVKHGGDNRGEYKFTLKNFAKEAGLNPKTLYQWCLLKRNVYDKLSAENRFKAKFSHLTFINRRVNSSTPGTSVNAAFKELFESPGIDQVVLRYCSDVSSLLAHLKKPNFKSLVDRKTAEELGFYLKQAAAAFDSHYPKIRAQNHGNAARYSGKRIYTTPLVGNMKTVDGVWINMKEKDEKIYRFMRRMGSRFVSPSTIGMAVGKELGRTFKKGSPFAASALRKLQSLGLAERNNEGHWRAIRKDF
jgi:hypothetical protein